MMLSSHKRRIIAASRTLWLQQLKQQHEHKYFASFNFGSPAVPPTRAQRLILSPILDKPYRRNNHHNMYFATWAVAATVSSVSAATFDKQSLMPQHQYSPPPAPSTPTSSSSSPLHQQIPKASELFPQLNIQLLPSSKNNSTANTIIATSVSLDDDETSATAPSTATLYPNSVEPIEFESSLFKGKVLLLFPTTETDRESESEQEKKEQAAGAKNTKLMEIQIQGKFKQPPKGTVYFGIQLVDNQRMNQLAGWKKG